MTWLEPESWSSREAVALKLAWNFERDFRRGLAIRFLATKLLPLADKYYGYCSASEVVRGELQVVPMLTALFWEVEHAAIYKPSPRLVDLTRRPMMQQRVGDVLKALQAFDEEFEKLIRLDRLGEEQQ
jgi:hypothetical protein